MTLPQEHGPVSLSRLPTGAGVVARRPAGGDVLGAVGVVRCFARDTVLFVAGSTPDFHARVVDGVLRVATSTGSGRRQIAAFLYPGDALTTRWLRDDAWTVEAVTVATVISCPIALTDRLLADEPDTARHLLVATETKLVDILQQRGLLSRRFAAERVAGFLLRLANRFGSWSADGAIVCDLPMSRNDMADYLALTVETVCREFSRLRRDGLIALPEARRVLILRPLALRQIVDYGI